MSFLRVLLPVARIGSAHFRQNPIKESLARTARRNYCSGEHDLIYEISDAEEYHEKVIEQSRTVPVLVDCYADWCGPCKNLGPRLEEKVSHLFLFSTQTLFQIRNLNGSVVLVKVNVDTAGEVAVDLGVNAVPTVFAVVDGEEAGHFTGDQPDEQLDIFIDKIIRGETPATIP